VTPSPFPARESEKKAREGKWREEMPELRPGEACSGISPECSLRDGLSSWCADCHVEATRAYRQRRREAEAEAAWRRRKAETEKLRRWEVERRARVEQRLGIRPRQTVN
jgi:hypothetical protein